MQAQLSSLHLLHTESHILNHAMTLCEQHEDFGCLHNHLK
jgi:hypothetical protein